MLSGVGTVNVRVNKQTHYQLGKLANEIGVSMQVMIDRAVELYRRQCFLDGLNADFECLKERGSEWDDEKAEREIWDSTLCDGLSSS